LIQEYDELIYIPDIWLNSDIAVKELCDTRNGIDLDSPAPIDARGYKTDRDDAVFEPICLGYSAGKECNPTAGSTDTIECNWRIAKVPRSDISRLYSFAPTANGLFLGMGLGAIVGALLKEKKVEMYLQNIDERHDSCTQQIS
jgi:hypothetical protein